MLCFLSCFGGPIIQQTSTFDGICTVCDIHCLATHCHHSVCSVHCMVTSDLITIIIKTQLNRLYYEEPYKKFGPDPKQIFIRLPYLGDSSNRLLGSLNSCLNQIKLGTINVNISYYSSRLEGNHSFKDKQPKHLLNGVVYQITCSCGLHYIGETSRCLKVRLDEHCKREGTNMTEVGKHLAESPDHTIKGYKYAL